MKKYLILLATALLLGACASDDIPVGTQDSTQLADVTIMYYDHGATTLDGECILNIRQMYQAEKSCYKNVKIAIEYKFSTLNHLPYNLYKYHSKEEMEEEFRKKMEKPEDYTDETYITWMYPKGSSTFRFVLDPTKTLKQQADDNYLPGENADITNPDSLTNFMNWVAKNCPAKKYVLILGDHGGGYMPHEEIYNDAKATTRGIMYDDGNNDKHFTALSLAHAIKAANIRPDVLFLDACLMNNMEYMFELKDVTDYIIASTFDLEFNIICTTMIECVSGASENLKYAFEKYIEYISKNYDNIMVNEVVYYNDLTMTETAKLDELGKAMREFTDRLCNTYKYGTAEQKQRIDEVTKYAVKINKQRPLYDVARYMEGIRRALPEVIDDEFWAELKAAFNNCIAAQYTGKYLQDHDYQVDYSVLMATKGVYQQAGWKTTDDNVNTLIKLLYYEPDGNIISYKVTNGVFVNGVTPNYTLEEDRKENWGGTLQSVYSALAFDKATGWSRWLLLNEQQPSLWCNNDFKIPLPDISDK